MIVPLLRCGRQELLYLLLSPHGRRHTNVITQGNTAEFPRPTSSSIKALGKVPKLEFAIPLGQVVSRSRRSTAPHWLLISNYFDSSSILKGRRAAFPQQLDESSYGATTHHIKFSIWTLVTNNRRPALEALAHHASATLQSSRATLQDCVALVERGNLEHCVHSPRISIT